MRYLKILAAVSLGMVLLGACGGPAEDPAGEGSSESSEAAVSRGAAESSIPEFATTPARRAAAEFVRAAATPDARLDTTPTEAWRRAAPYATSELAPLLTEAKDSGTMPGWWRRLTETDGYISIEITNIAGDEPQAAPPPGSPTTPTAAPGEELPLEVMFTRTTHIPGRVPGLGGNTRTWVVMVRDGKVVNFKPDPSE